MTTTTGTTTRDIEQFIDGFRNEHRAARDVFLGIADAFRQRDAARIGELMGQANTGIGPHMRYEEETMYAALTDFFGPAYVEKMLADHDRALGVAGKLMELAAHTPITDADAAQATSLIQGMLPHVSDCDGLALFVEKLPAPQQRALVESRNRAVREGLTMMEWAQRRGRAPIPPDEGA
ncbi:MAG: hemerythrin domain-containing protein [Chloroflexi bacterium]|nr:hemerythrin domain-containing protein [Chloroflexota bacterium]